MGARLAGEPDCRFVARATETYAFIDANSLRLDQRRALSEIYGEAPEGIDFKHLEEVIEQPSTLGTNSRGDDFAAHKVFWYDAIPDPLVAESKGDENDPAFQSRQKTTAAQIQARETEFAAIRDRAGWHARDGSHRPGRRGRSARQKEVDIMLACEALRHVYRGNARSLVLMLGDLDFRPLVDELVGLGANVTVLCGKESASAGLRSAADHVIELRARHYWHFASADYRQKHPWPTRVRPPDGANPKYRPTAPTMVGHMLQTPRGEWFEGPGIDWRAYSRWELGVEAST